MYQCIRVYQLSVSVEKYQCIARFDGKGTHGSHLGACEKSTICEMWQFFLNVIIFTLDVCFYSALSLKNWAKYFLNLLGRFETYSGLCLYLDSDLEKLLVFLLLGSYLSH